MKTFLCKIIIFTFPLLLLAIGAEFYARAIPNSYKYKNDWMDLHKDSVRILILGESSLYCAVVPSQLDKAFNLANSSQILEIDKWLITKYLSQCPNLETIILPMDIVNMFAIEYEQRSSVDWNRAIYYNIYMGYDKHSCFSKYHYELSCPQFITKKILKYSLCAIKGTAYDFQCDSLGRGTTYKKEAKDTLKLKKKEIERQIKRINKEHMQERINYNYSILEDIIRLCDNKKIRLLLVSTPYWYMYNQYLDKEQLRLFYNTVDKLGKNNRIEYVDYRDDGNFSSNQNLFKNSMHLSDDGAMIFTKVLKENCDL